MVSMRESKYSLKVKNERNREIFAKYKTGLYPAEKLAGIYNVSAVRIWQIVKFMEGKEEQQERDLTNS